MAEDFYIDDYYGGDFYDGGSDLYLNGGSDFYFDSFEPIDYAPDFELIPFAPYEPLPDLPTFEQEPFFPMLPFTPLLEVGFLEPLPPIDLFAETIQMETEPGLLPTQQPVILPDLAPLPFVPTPIEPVFEFFPLPYVPIEEPPQSPKLGPCNTPNGLPGACPQGSYHPQSNPCACVPFPPALTQTQTPKPPTTTTPTTAPKPPSPTQQTPQQQAQVCPTGYCKHPQTGQCMQIPVGYVRHPQTQVCTLATQQQTPPEEDIFAQLKTIPWWVWAGIAGVFILQGGRR